MSSLFLVFVGFNLSDKPFFYSFAENFRFMAGIYLHIPFCKKRCIYCDFFSTTRSEQKNSIHPCLMPRTGTDREAYLGRRSDIETIYLGGGTPSQLA